MKYNLFTTESAVKAQKRVFTNRGNIIAPGMVSDTPMYLRLMRNLADKLTSSGPADIDDLGVSGSNAITGDFYTLRTVSGYQMKTLTLPPRSNANLRADLKLADGFKSARHEAIWTELFDAMFTKWIPGNLAIARISSTGFPYFRSQVQLKKDIFLYHAQNMNKILDLVMKGDMERAFTEFYFVIANYLSRRAQPDRVIRNADGTFSSKDRLVNDWVYAKTGGEEGKRFVSDKSVYINGQLVPGHFGMRIRTVYAMSACLNYFLTAIFSGFRNHYLYEYEFTWKHRTPDQIFAKISKYTDVIGVDVSQYDQSFGGWMFDWWVEQLAKKSMDERLARMIRMGLSAPYYSTHPEVGKAGGFWLGNPLDKSTFNLDVGLASGIAPNPDLGKFGFTAAMLCAIDDYSHDVAGQVARILKGQHPLYGLLNMGDDSLIMSNSQGLTQFTRDALDPETDSTLSPYFLAEKEKSISFLGNVLHRRYDGTRALVPNIGSFVVNWFVPERGIDSKMRRFWPIGWHERQIYYSKAPFFSDALEIVEREVRDTFGVSMDALAQHAKKTLRLPKMPQLSAEDQIVLEDPSKLYYRFDPQTISSVLLDELVCSLPEQVVTPLVTPFLKGQAIA